jgi:hypothetical protein
MSKKLTVTILIFSMLFFLGTVGIMISMTPIDKQTEDTTTDYSATVSNIQITDTGKSTYVAIQTKEYDSALQISTNISDKLNMDDVRRLQEDQKIFFRIENTKAGQMNTAQAVHIVSLQTEQTDIFTLDDYNAYMKQAAYPARIASMIAALGFLAIFCIFLIRYHIGKRKHSS